MGDIGKPLKKIDLEPIPDDVPVPEIVPEREPELLPEKEREPVPAGVLYDPGGTVPMLLPGHCLPPGRRAVRAGPDWLEQSMTDWFLYGDVYFERPRELR